MTFSVTNGHLPDGLALSAAGALAGVPSVGGTFRYTVTAMLPSGVSVSRDERIHISVARLTGLGVSPAKFKLTGRRAHGRCAEQTAGNEAHPKCQRPIKLTIRYTLNAAATVTFTIAGKSPGRKVKGRCVKPTGKNRNRKMCIRLVKLRGSIVQAGKAGANSFTFDGKVGGHQITPGAYQLTATPKGGKLQTVGFTISR
jgi:hypothetical protein